MLKVYLLIIIAISACSSGYKGVNSQITTIVEKRLSSLPTQRSKEIRKAIMKSPEDEREGAAFLYAYMPQHDLDTLSVELIAKNVAYAYKARREYEWAREVPLDIFYNDVLPYVTMDETRENWREQFYNLLNPLVRDCKDIFEVVSKVNKEFINIVKVRYSTEREKANQSPNESMKIGMASCSGLSILLTDALRAVGVPSRIAGTPMWVTKEGNHNWSEVWINGKWYFTEYYPDKLNHSWFLVRCAAFEGNVSSEHQVYVTSFKPTGKGHFPMVWNMDDKTVYGEVVTERYIAEYKRQEGLSQKNMVAVTIKVIKKGGSLTVSDDRRAIGIKVLDSNNREVVKGKSKGAASDMNDYLIVYLEPNSSYQIEYSDKLAKFNTDNSKTKEIILEVNSEGLTKEEADSAVDKYIKERQNKSLAEYGDEWENRELKNDKYSMKFHYGVIGERPIDGRAMYISMHGGGGTTAAINDKQWDNQKRLYTPAEGVYFVPRAATNTWNMWHQEYMDGFIEKIIEMAVIKEGVNPNKVYIMGYSAGGDGTYQLAPRLADLWAAAAMSAGHPGDAHIENLRNLPFALYMGGQDGAYDRNKHAAMWGKQLDSLAAADTGAYIHDVHIYPQYGHWMKGTDKVSMIWMPKYLRNSSPTRVVWMQDDVLRSRFYWLQVDENNMIKNSRIVARYEGNSIFIDESTVDEFIVGVNDKMMNLDKAIRVYYKGKIIFNGKVRRVIENIKSDIFAMRDRDLVFPVKLLIANNRVTVIE